MANNNINNVIEQIKKDLMERAEKTMVQAKKEFIPVLKHKVERCWVSAINNYYMDYDQDYYKRKYDFYDMLRTNIDANGDLIIKVSSDELQEHRVDNDYIFKVMFLGGWHGGATHGVDPWGNVHPNDGTGTPYWRSGRFINDKGERSYSRWGRRAYVSPISPDQDFQNQLDEIRDEMRDKYIEIFNKYWSN